MGVVERILKQYNGIDVFHPSILIEFSLSLKIHVVSVQTFKNHKSHTKPTRAAATE